jgi:hypothetical protein
MTTVDYQSSLETRIVALEKKRTLLKTAAMMAFAGTAFLMGSAILASAIYMVGLVKRWW